ncbi:hypothetical protein AN914_25960 [Mycobacteroides immunogenum]|nr:hypothetical protein AN914_25960 [Mycobacteroides immunogenum]
MRKSLSDNADAGQTLTNRSDKELQQLPPAAIDLLVDWQIAQSRSVIRHGTDATSTLTWRADLRKSVSGPV